ncbi:hypothetical protein [Streptomyces gardneri]|uniref:hypothetical protein n=1 Tax=Streptomyces gardneri TaxID=66892 RepID=UPI0037D6752A
MRISENGKTRGIFLSACAVAVVLAGTAACTSDGDGPPARATATPTAAACKNGTYAWFNVDERDVLTGIAEKQKITAKGGGELTNKLRPLHTPRVAVTFEKGSRVGDAKDVLRSLGIHIGEIEQVDAADGSTHEFTNVRRAAPDINDGSTRMLGPGTFVEYASVRQVTADFQYTCGTGGPVTGRATSWTIDGGGMLECFTPIKPTAKKGDPSLAAARLSCGPDAPASKA